jgi:hypothetical protein
VLDTDGRLRPGTAFRESGPITLESHSVVVLSRPSSEA